MKKKKKRKIVFKKLPTPAKKQAKTIDNLKRKKKRKEKRL